MIEKKWVIEPSLPQEIAHSLSAYNEGFQQLLYNRGIYTADEAEHYLTAEGSLYDPFLLDGMEKVVDRIAFAISNDEKIVVYGDYDVDGVSATTLLVQVLTSLKADVNAYIPNRFDEGYGLNVEALRELAGNGTKLVITVDCGIRSTHEITEANRMGLDIIVSDHHHPGSPIPPAFEIINPKKANDRYPEKNLAGVGVAYKIAQALSERIDKPRVDADEYLDLVALGTVSDIVPLVGENRALVKAGIKKLREGKNRGLFALAGAAKINIHQVTSQEIGFMLGPRLNAAGRITSARAAYDLLITSDPNQASLLAQKLDDLNRKRQSMVVQMVETAHEDIGTDDVYLVLSFRSDYEQGVVGLVASRLTDEFYRPAVIGQVKEGFAVASCRSIPGFHHHRCTGSMCRSARKTRRARDGRWFHGAPRPHPRTPTAAD